MKPSFKLDGDMCDVFSRKARAILIFRAGDRKKTKRRYNKKDRRVNRSDPSVTICEQEIRDR